MSHFSDASAPVQLSSSPEDAGFGASAEELHVGARASTFLARYAAFEFIAVAAISYLTSLVYGETVWTAWPDGHPYVGSAFLLAAGVLVASIGLGQYSAFQIQPRHRVLWNAGASVIVTFAFFLSGLFILKVTTDYSRAAFVLQLVTVFVAVLTIRTVAHARICSAIANGRVEAQRAVIIGGTSDTASVAKKLAAAGIKVVRTLPFPSQAFGVVGSEVHSEVRNIVESCRALRPDNIVIVSKAAQLAKSAGLAGFLSELPASVHLVPLDTGALLDAARLGELGALVTVEAVRSPLSVADRICKRLFDILAASFGLISLAPLLIFVAIAVKLNSRGPVLFRQVRHGYNNDKIFVCKFRTMTTMESGDAFTQATKNNSRITQVGRILRRSNLDELPQLFNVLSGQMSIVGPRPHPVAINRSFEQYISRLSRRHNVKPGITGWAQVNGYRGETDTLEKMQSRFEYDIYYIDNWSFMFDLRIILLTLFSKSAYRNAE